MFVVTCIGWLIFRETELHQLIADLRLSPSATTEIGRSTGLYLFLLVLLYSIPLWIHDVWAERRGVRVFGEQRRWGSVTAQAAWCGVMFALILALRSETALNFIYFAF
jgi:hypothetical protein